MNCLATISMLLAVGCSPQMAGATDPGKPSSKVYEVVHTVRPQVKLDGVIDEPIWKRADLESDFCFPWRDDEAPRTEFRAVCDDTHLYFCFNVEDGDIVIDKKTEGEETLIAEDRVELFFAPDVSLKEYYCVEIDVLGRKLDYKASFHRKFDDSWEFPGLQCAGRRTPKGYAVEGGIPLKTLVRLDLPRLQSGKLRVGMYRAEFSHSQGPAPIEKWISWVNPRTDEEDFHVPKTFGILRAKRVGGS